MRLTEDINKLKNDFAAQAPAEILTAIGQAIEGLRQAGITDNSCKQGDMAPVFNLPNVRGENISLSELLTKGPVVLNFYRGVWWPFCNLELRALQLKLSEITSLGAQLVAVSPQLPDNSLSTAEKLSLTFEVLSDVGNKVARDFGIVFTLPETLRDIYKGFGIDLPASNGDQTFELPVPATYIIDRQGII